MPVPQLCCLFWLWCDGVAFARFIVTNRLKSIVKAQRASSESSETSAEHEGAVFHFGKSTEDVGFRRSGSKILSAELKSS